MPKDEVKTLSVQPRYGRTTDAAVAYYWTFFERALQDELPVWGDVSRTAFMRDFVDKEPIIGGAVSSMISKVVSLDWEIIGGRNKAQRNQEMLAQAADGVGWSTVLESWLYDYWTSDLGGVLELGHPSEKDDRVAGVYNLDAARLTLTGNMLSPLVYTAATGKVARLKQRDFTRIVDMPSPDETYFYLGHCAATRAYKAAKVLMMMYQYEEERLSDLPPQGIASVTGITETELTAAMALYDARRKSKNQLTFKGLLWLVSTMSPLNQIDVKLTPFSQLPEHFNKEQTVNMYVNTLALDFGVDVREFWPMSMGPLGSGAEAQIQAAKAKGKGFGMALAKIERAINWNVLPEGLEFRFDNQDSESDMLRETIRYQTIKNIVSLYIPEPPTPAAPPGLEQGTPGPEGGVPPEGEQQGANVLMAALSGIQPDQQVQPNQQARQKQQGDAEVPLTTPPGPQSISIITRDEARRLLVELGALPEWVIPDANTTVSGDSNTPEERAKAFLRPGEQLVSVRRNGELSILSRNRRYFV
jgi:hypothetical protein